MLERRSALASLLGRHPPSTAGGVVGVRLGEVRGFSLTQVAAFPAAMSVVEAKVAAVVGMPAPASAAMPAHGGSWTVFRTGPGQFWLIGPDVSDVAVRLAAEIAPAEGAVTSLSHSRTRIFAEGARAADVLRKGVPLDFALSAFPVGGAAMTGLHHTPILIHRVGEARFEIYAMRTFALTVFEWLADAAQEFGVGVVA
jgi:sarcosine oxidase subunit gamma